MAAASVWNSLNMFECILAPGYLKLTSVNSEDTAWVTAILGGRTHETWSASAWCSHSSSELAQDALPPRIYEAVLEVQIWSKWQYN